jgi:crotonobetainyl-CoA:carnitine CoA-transferase CaiB-like acyl-CoA transferase
LFCAIEPKFWQRFCALIDRPDLAANGAGETQPVDFAHGDDQLRRTLQSVFETRPQHEWLELAIANDLPIGPAHQGVGALLDDEHLRARTIIVEDVHPVAGPFTYVGSPVIVDGEPFAVRRPAPGLGEHTDEVLTEIGLDADEIYQLRANGVI